MKLLQRHFQDPKIKGGEIETTALAILIYLLYDKQG